MSHEWRNILIEPTSRIDEAIEIIEKEALRLVLIVDEKKCLLGTVTDGDIRRALIKHVPMSSQVQEIMNANPKTANIDTPRKMLLAIMERYELLSIPLIDDGVLVGLETLLHVISRPKYDNPVFLMAGGFGARLRPLTDNCPKPLLKVGDKPILEIILTQFIDAGFHQFFISTHYLPEMIREYFGDGSEWDVSITYIHESEPLGTGGALGLLPDDLVDLPMIVMNGDVLTKLNFEELLRFHNKKNAHATICVRKFEYQVPFGVVESEGYKIKSMVEKPVQRFHVNAGIYIVGRKLIDSVAENEQIDMPSLLDRHVSDELVIYPFHEYWLDIGRMDDFYKAQIDINEMSLYR